MKNQATWDKIEKLALGIAVEIRDADDMTEEELFSSVTEDLNRILSHMTEVL